MNKEQKESFLYGYLYAKAENLKEEFDIKMSIEDIIRELISKAMEKEEKMTMITVNKEQFSCKCGANVFKKEMLDVVICNACGLRYQKE